MTEAEIRSELYAFLEGCRMKEAKAGAIRRTPFLVSNVVDGLRAAAYLHDGIAAPTWLDPVPDLEAADIIACKNGLSYISSAEMLPYTPRFFTQRGRASRRARCFAQACTGKFHID